MESEVDDSEEITIEDVLRELHKKSLNVRLLGLVVTVMLVIIVGLATMVQGINHSVDDVKESTRATNGSVNHLERFVSRLETPSEAEIAQNRAVSQAVAQVPQIKGILCEQFPKASNCQETR